MKEEPLEVLEEIGDGGSDYYAKSGFQNSLKLEYTGDGEIDIKFVFPTAIPVNPVRETKLDTSPVTVTPEQPPYFKSGWDEFRSDDAYAADEAEVDEIKAIINEGEVNVQDMKPVAIPNPIIRPVGLAKTNDDGEIIINYQKKRKLPAQPKPCICLICDTGFPSQQLFQLHMSNVHADKRPYPCSHCGKRFAQLCQMIKHETIHDPNRFKGEPKFACDMCDKKYHLKATLEGHRKLKHLGYKKPKRPASAVVRQHHSVGVKNHRAPEKEVKLFQCPHCDLKFGMRCLLQNHLTCHTKEKPYRCEECDQTFSLQSSLTSHMRVRHLNPSSNPRPSRPTFMYNQPCPCTICGKIYKIPSKLKRHMRLHTGEKPHECSECGQRFRIKQGLAKHFKLTHVIQRQKERLNENEAYKCLICGRDDFVSFGALRNHRHGAHRHIPIPTNTEREMPYGCGICGKPWNTRGHAMDCAVLRHDPTSLLKAMFRFKCPRCPEEECLGFHNTIALRRHWEKEHPDKPLPVQYRAPSGMYGKKVVDTLPNVKVNPELAKRIRENGPEVKSEFPLYTEFDLLPIQDKFCKRKKKEPKQVMKHFPCDICGTTIVYRRNFIRHIKLHEEGKIGQRRYNCGVCGKRFSKCKTLRLHERQHKNDNDKPKMMAEGKVEQAANQTKKGCLELGTVNVNDSSAVQSILGNRAISIILSRANNNNNSNVNKIYSAVSVSNFNDDSRQLQLVGGKIQAKHKLKVLQIMLQRIDQI